MEICLTSWVGVNNADAYTIQSNYWALKGLPHIQENVSFREVWSLKVPKKAKVFRWKVLLDRLPTRVNLECRGVGLSCNACLLCNKEIESIQHLLITCKVAQRLWIKCDRWVGLTSVRVNDIVNHFYSFHLVGLSKKANCVWKGMWLAITKAIWTHRNMIIFNGGQVDEI